MNTNLIHHSSWHSPKLLEYMLLAVAVFLAIAGSFAPTPTPTATPIPWPPKELADRKLVAQAVVEAMRDYANNWNPGLREKLTHPVSAHAEIERRVSTLSGGRLHLPAAKDESVFVFYVPDEPFSTPSPGASSYIKNRYYTVLYLPTPEHPIEQGTDYIPILNTHLRCCYEPWAPN